MPHSAKKIAQVRKLLQNLTGRRAQNEGRPALGKKVTYKTGFGPVGISKGWGGQPRVSSIEKDFDRKAFGVGKGRYSDLAVKTSELKDVFSKGNMPARAMKSVRQKAISRRLAMLRGIVIGAENSPQRFLGADKVARAALRHGKKKGYDYVRIFAGKDPTFAMAGKGGARAYRRFAEGGNNLTADQLDVLDYMSSDSDGSDAEMDVDEPEGEV